jgi:O-antigen/teichoic acid export membrane protein
MSSVGRRLVASFGANSLSRIVTTLIQVVSVPLFLKHWGTIKYGEWIVLSTIPSYFGLSDIGFGSVAGNEMTVLMAKERISEALETFQSVWLFTTAISSLVGALLFASIWFIPIENWIHLQSFSKHDARLVILFLGLSILLSMQETLFQAAFRSTGQYAYGTAMKNVFVLGSFGMIVVPLILGVSPPGVALCYLLANAVGTCMLWFILRRKVPWIEFGVKHASFRAIRRLSIPAISMMSVPFSTILSLQGIVIVIGHVLGPAAVVTFSTARTVSRSASQVMQLINNAVWPEMSTAFGAGNVSLARQLHRRACQLSIFLCVCVSLVVAVLGRYVWSAWTMGKVSTDPVLLDIMLVQLLISSLWYTSSVVPISINKHSQMAKVLVFSSSLSLACSWILMRIPSLHLRGAPIGLVIGDLINAIYIVKISLNILDDRLPAFVASIFQIPNLSRLKPSALLKSK